MDKSGPKGVPHLLIGLKRDLCDEKTKQINYDFGKKMCDEHGFDGYIECSAKSMWNVKGLFHQAI